MFIRTIIPLLFLLLFSLPAQAGNSFSSSGETGQWIMEYYKNPEPERLADALIMLAESQGIPEDGQKLIFSFMGAALVKAPEVHDDFFKSVAKHDRAKLLAFPCFWFMGDEAGKDLIRRGGKDWDSPGMKDMAAQFEKSPAPNLLKGPVKNALHLDHLWSMFFATGSPEPVLKVISALALVGNADINRHLTGQYAQWSLKANAKMHQKVLEIIESTLKMIKEPLKSKLAKTVEP